MSKVVYLLGAGASYGKRKEEDNITMDDVTIIDEGLPVVNEIEEELNFVIGWLNGVDVPEDDYNLFGKKHDGNDLKEELVNGLEWLLEQSSRHATIDTFAKKMFLKNDKENYARLKFLLSSFFLIEQSLHPYDKRYDAFLASILDKDLNIPEDIFIMTWNYDVQIDLAYRDYNEMSLPMLLPPETKNVNNKARVFKINGSANYYCANHMDSSMCLEENRKALLKHIFVQLDLTTKNGHYNDGTTDLLFAWEKNRYDEMSNLLYQNLSDTQILVVIGYTFPFFNREIDREIFSKMSNLNKIYVQDPNADKVKITLKSIIPAEKYKCLINNDDLIFDTTNFFLPPEL